MGRKAQEPIETISYMPLNADGTGKVCVSDLNQEQRDYIGSLLHTALLNAAYAGKFAFWAEDMPPPESLFSAFAQSP